MSESSSILIVDDDVPALNMVVRLLTSAGHEVAQATTGAEALRLARQFKPDLILLDVGLPDMSGLEVLRQIKADIEMEHTSVVLFSSQAVSAHHQSAGLDTGSDGYIARPIPNQELLARVRLHLRQHALARALRASEARFRDLIAHQADAVLVIDEAGLILFANPAAQILYGRPAATLVGSPFDFPIACATSQEIHLHRPDASDIVAEMRVAPSQWEGKPAWVASLRDITESQIVRRNLQDSENTQKLLAIRLKEEKERLLAAQAVANIGSWETNLATWELTWSAQTHRIFETDAASFRPTHAAFLLFVHPDDRERVDKATLQSLESTGSFAMEYRVQLPDGRIKFVEERWQNFTEGARKPVKAIGTCHDITERKQAEQAQAQLLGILETSLNEVYYFDPDSLRFAYVNPGALRNLGYALEPMQAMTPLDLKREFTEDAFRQLIAPLIRREQAQLRFETIHRRADGSHYPVEMILQLVERQNKQIVLAVVRDNTERRQAELARDASEDRFRLLWQTCPTAIVLTDRDSIIRYANPALQQVFGHAPAALIGNSLALLQPQRLAAAHLGGMRRHLETGQRSMDWRAVETTGLHKDGHEFPIEIAFSSMEIGGELLFAGFMRDITERNQTEQALRDSEHQLRGLAESMPQMVWMTRADDRAAYFNQRWVDYTGLTPEESQGHGWTAAVHPDDRDAAWQAWQKATAELAEYKIEYRLRRTDGSYRWMLTRGVPFRDTTGRVEKWMGTCTDIDDLKRATDQITQNSLLLRVAGKTARVGGFAISVPGQRLTWSDEVFDIVELPVGNEPALEFALNMPTPEWREPLATALELCMRDGTPFDMEAQMVSAKGRRLWVRVVVQAQRDAAGAIFQVGGALQDLTQIKLAEQSARESAERFRLLSKASRDAIWDWELQADTLWWNEGYQQLFGLQHDPSKTGVQEREAAMHPQDRERVMTGIRQAVAGSATVWSDSYRLLRSDGSEAQVDDRGYLMRDAAGRAIRMVGALTDVSAKVQLEEQLRQSQRLESIGQLTGGVAHDFNNLLTVVLGNAELLQEALIQDPAHQELASMIGSAAQRGAELTQRLLAFARKQPLYPEPLDVNRLVSSFEPLLRRTLGEHIKIALAPGSNLCHALADATQLESALLNLCINSRDAMPDGGTITIETANIRLDQEYASRYLDLRPGDYVMLAVSDDGHGMDPQVAGRVFEPFFTTKEKAKGSGLGLSMVYGFVKQSNGHVSLDSAPSHGTTVRLYLPRVSELADQPTNASDQPQLSGGRETILLVEDDEMVRAYVRGQLAALGYEVKEAPDGNHALDILRSGAAIDLLFTDVVMPGMGGAQLFEQALLLRPGLKVLYTSGYTDDSLVHHGRPDPDLPLLSKPYRRSALANMLREVLDC